MHLLLLLQPMQLLVLKRLMINTFLEKSADVNFDAKTTKAKDGKIKFVDQQYEYKDSQWKLYYRAGKESLTAARTFAQNWIKEF